MTNHVRSYVELSIQIEIVVLNHLHQLYVHM